MLRRERLPELGLLRMGIVAILRVQRRWMGCPSVSCVLVVVDWGRRWVVVRICWVSIGGQLVVRSRRATEDGLVCLVTTFFWRLSWPSRSMMIHGVCNVDVNLWWSLADNAIVVVGAIPCLELLLALVESLWDEGCSSSSSAMAALDERKSQMRIFSESTSLNMYIQTHNSHHVNQDEAPCRATWRREQHCHKPQPGQYLGALLGLGG